MFATKTSASQRAEASASRAAAKPNLESGPQLRRNPIWHRLATQMPVQRQEGLQEEEDQMKTNQEESLPGTPDRIQRQGLGEIREPRPPGQGDSIQRLVGFEVEAHDTPVVRAGAATTGPRR